MADSPVQRCDLFKTIAKANNDKARGLFLAVREEREEKSAISS